MFLLMVLLLRVDTKYRLERVLPVEDSGIVNMSRYRTRNLPAAGALLKAEDSEEKQDSLF